MKTIQEMVDVMLAYKRGEQIQYRDTTCEQWIDVIKEPKWYYWPLRDYRIKPKFRPFKSAEEFLEAQRKHGEELINIFEDEVLTADDIYISINGNAYKRKDTIHDYNLYPIGELKDLLIYYKLIDGTPCRKEVEI